MKLLYTRGENITNNRRARRNNRRAYEKEKVVTYYVLCLCS